MEIFILVAWVAGIVQPGQFGGSQVERSSLVHIGEFSSQDACIRAADFLKSSHMSGKVPIIETWCLPKQ
ncbi:hypothetical protein [Paracoccus chinensis]|uniref:hypothetical protein n=1 Tax=Paracoccus chinensis TaxID=525640 RepID=UPI000B820FD5|nr:hypothetical protein [Paracoccus chinensis]